MKTQKMTEVADRCLLASKPGTFLLVKDDSLNTYARAGINWDCRGELGCLGTLVIDYLAGDGFPRELRLRADERRWPRQPSLGTAP